MCYFAPNGDYSATASVNKGVVVEASPAQLRVTLPYANRVAMKTAAPCPAE